MTALMLACSEAKGEVATVLVEPTRQAGALDLQDAVSRHHIRGKCEALV